MEMFKMAPPYGRMNSARIRVVQSGGSCLGDIITYEDKKKGLFGLRIDVAQPPVAGKIVVDVLKPTKAQIQGIKKLESTEIPFEITL
ncbi:MAG: hypothetical protein WC485_08225 [Opitutaceae bacterium]